MKSGIRYILLAIWAAKVIQASDSQRFLQKFEGAVRPHSINVDGSRLEKRSSTPAFEILQEEWSVEAPKAGSKKIGQLKSATEACRKDVHKIYSAADLARIRHQCKEVIGTVHIVDFTDSIIDLGTMEKIQGNLIIENLPQIVKIQASRLNEISGTLKLDSLTSLTDLHFPTLQHFEAIDWKVVPTLTAFNLAPNITSAKRIIISDSSLVNIGGLQNIEELEVLNINNNRYMENVDSKVKRIFEQLSISANSRELRVNLPELKWANNITIRDASSTSFPQLQYVNHSLEFIENYFESLPLPVLKSVGGTLGLLENPHLEQVDFSNVTNIQGGLMIANNSRIQSINFLPQLREIGGAIQFFGTFQEISLPLLKLVRGSALIKSTSNVLDCSKWTTPVSGNSIIRGGQIICNSGRVQSSARVSEDGTLLGREQKESANISDNERNSGSFIVDKSKLPAFGFALAFGWIAALICFLISQ